MKFIKNNWKKDMKKIESSKKKKILKEDLFKGHNRMKSRMENINKKFKC